MIAQNKKLLL